VQIFESFGAALSPALFSSLSLEPIGRIVAALKAARPRVKTIVFVRGGGAHLSAFAAAGVGDGLGLDWSLDPKVVRPSLPRTLATQGNLDPLALVAGGDPLAQGIDRVLEAVRGTPHIFNLGHGIPPETPVEHVEALLARVRKAP
jgi:uroporphyrinogen decarboxylase